MQGMLCLCVWVGLCVVSYAFLVLCVFVCCRPLVLCVCVVFVHTRTCVFL